MRATLVRATLGSLVLVSLAPGALYGLERTLSIQNLDGSLTLSELSPLIEGDFTYSLINDSDEPVHVLYFIVAPTTSIRNILDAQQNAYSAQTEIRYDLQSYRIEIPPLAPDKTMQIRIQFRARSTASLGQSAFFLNAHDWWFPMPFHMNARFPYRITISQPQDTYAILGGRVVREDNLRGIRRSTWQSEIKDYNLSLNLFVGKTPRFIKENIYYYGEGGSEVDGILDMGSLLLTRIQDLFPKYPLHQVHFIAHNVDLGTKQDIFNALFLANSIYLGQIPNLYPPAPQRLSVHPQSSLRLYESMAHEMSHGVLPGMLRLHREQLSTLEAVVETMALLLVDEVASNSLERFLNRNRVSLINMSLQGYQYGFIWPYLHSVNTLAVTAPDIHSYARVFNKLVANYSDSVIDTKQIIRALSADPTTKGRALLALWQRHSLYNLTVGITTNNRLVHIQHNFPVTITGLAIETLTNGKLRSNWLRVYPYRTRTWKLSRATQSMRFVSPFQFLEVYWSDNEVSLSKNFASKVVDIINTYYLPQEGGASEDSMIAILPDAAELQEQWSTLQAHMRFYAKQGSYVYYRWDSFHDTDTNVAYLYAYKYVNNVQSALVEFRMRKQQGRYIVDGIFDPTRTP